MHALQPSHGQDSILRQYEQSEAPAHDGIEGSIQQPIDQERAIREMYISMTFNDDGFFIRVDSD